MTEDLAVSSFVPFFSFDATSNLIVDNDDFAVDATRCASSPDYPAFVASTRTPWLMATHPDVFEGEPRLNKCPGLACWVRVCWERRAKFMSPGQRAHPWACSPLAQMSS